MKNEGGGEKRKNIEDIIDSKVLQRRHILSSREIKRRRRRKIRKRRRKGKLATERSRRD